MGPRELDDIQGLLHVLLCHPCDDHWWWRRNILTPESTGCYPSGTEAEHS